MSCLAPEGQHWESYLPSSESDIAFPLNQSSKPRTSVAVVRFEQYVYLIRSCIVLSES
ncbi:hypothetical protein FA13DRAFT_1739467 [Coprinellus micaceus]|uniref:Uncharacterized protein n=1 Tax=Coprinellus micaceus TaxID=71717 RepID=A0A4Y7SQG4_COPMI|nr:hypothetical protein FA13DRAFT_1739467 [Coprinellus micaceus]